MRFIGFLVTIVLATGLSWLLVGTFIHDLVPGGWRTIVIAWALSIVPLFVLIRNIASARYPSAIVRLLLFRPFWYAQLLMLPLALAGSTAALLALPFGAAGAFGRAVVLLLAPLLVLLGFWGYVGSRRLVVRDVTLSRLLK